MPSIRNTFQTKGHILNESGGMQKYISFKWKSGAAIFISDIMDFKIKTLTRDKEGHYIMSRNQSKKKISQL